jgi:hypothetical protein
MRAVRPRNLDRISFAGHRIDTPRFAGAEVFVLTQGRLTTTGDPCGRQSNWRRFAKIAPRLHHVIETGSCPCQPCVWTRWSISVGGIEWTNWVGDQTCRPVEIAAPRTEEEVAAVVADAVQRGRALRVGCFSSSVRPTSNRPMASRRTRSAGACARAGDFVELRRRLDPHDAFLNDHLRPLFA